MDLSSLSDNQLQAALTEAVQRFISLTLDSNQDDSPDGHVFKNRLIGEILKEHRRRKNEV